MNTYNMTKNYYNYANNNYNQPLYNQNIQNKQIYDPYNGFIRGNMFPELYNSYKLNKPLEITPMNEQAELLTYVDALTFAMIDLNLYLDVYPNDREALELFNQYRMQADEYTKKYESKYGPLELTSNSLNTFPWAWDNAPWPWEKK
jgi:spore coat protein JB